MSVEHQISQAVLRFQTAALPEDVIRGAKRAVLDWLACALAGNTAPVGLAVQQFAASEGSTGHSTCLFPGLPETSARQAALINGTLSHALELDDIYAPALYHPGVCVIPAALSAAQQNGTHGMGLLRAVVAGYEISNRIGAAINPAHYQYWHTTGTVGAIGSVVAAAVALGLPRDQSDWAIANAATMAAGLKQAFRSEGMTKPLHAGRAAESGVLAASLAQAGFTGSDAMLSGPVGLAAAMGQGADLSGCLDDLFDSYTITQSTLKRFAACGHTFAAIDAALDMKANPQAIEQVMVHTYTAAIDAAGNPAPETVFEARFSIAFCVAAVLCGHDLSRVSALEAALSDAAVQALCQKVEVQASPAFDAAFPALRGASLRLHMQDGTEHFAHTETRKGAPENPLSNAELTAKMTALLHNSPFRETAQAWIDWCDKLGQVSGLRRASLPLARTSRQETPG